MTSNKIVPTGEAVGTIIRYYDFDKGAFYGN
jgi:hypothetical protein